MSFDFVALDFETANANRGSVCQIGIARFLGGQVTKTATLFVTPPPGYETFSPMNIGIHGIHASDVVGAPGWPEMLERLTNFTKDLPLVAHNASVERSVIDQASAAHRITPPPFRYFCTLKLARKVFPAEKTHSLGKLTASLGLPDFAHHDAGADAIASGRMLLHAATARGATSFQELSDGWMEKPKAARAPRLAQAA
jgi:DNA polymerase-3 subunit epsilon